jgi:hypothetical protein
MGNQMQEYLDKEKIIKDSNSLVGFINKQIKKDNDKLLWEYYSEFAKLEEHDKYNLGAFKFIQWIVDNK